MLAARFASQVRPRLGLHHHAPVWRPSSWSNFTQRKSSLFVPRVRAFAGKTGERPVPAPVADSANQVTHDSSKGLALPADSSPAAVLGRAGARDEQEGAAEAAEGDELALADEAELAALAAEGQRAGARAELNLTAGEYFNVGLLPEAEAAFQQLQVRVAAECGPRHPDMAAVLNNLGMTRLHRGRLPEARADLEAALQLREAEAAAAGDDTVLVSVLVNVALAARRAADLPRAAHALERAADILERLGSERALYPVVLNNLGLVRHAQAALPAALALFERAARTAGLLLRPPHRRPAPAPNASHPVDTRPTAEPHVDQFTSAYASLFRADPRPAPASAPAPQPDGDAELIAMEEAASAAERAETEDELRATLATALGNAMTCAARLGDMQRAEAHAAALVAELDHEDTPNAEGGGPHPQLVQALRTLSRAAVARRDCRTALQYMEQLQRLQWQRDAPKADLDVTARWLRHLHAKIQAGADSGKTT